MLSTQHHTEPKILLFSHQIRTLINSQTLEFIWKSLSDAIDYVIDEIASMD